MYALSRTRVLNLYVTFPDPLKTPSNFGCGHVPVPKDENHLVGLGARRRRSLPKRQATPRHAKCDCRPSVLPCFAACAALAAHSRPSEAALSTHRNSAGSKAGSRARDSGGGRRRRGSLIPNTARW